MTTANPAHTPGWAVAVLGVLLLPLAGLGFALSFQMMLPVMVIAGWSVAIAWGGPVLVDLAAASGALMQMVSKDPGIRRWGTGVLGFSTLLSIFMNLAGHSIERGGHALPAEYAGMRLGGGWQWVVILMSIATPLFIAVLVHAFGHVLMAYLAGRSGRIGSTPIESADVGLAPIGPSAADPIRPPIVATDRPPADALKSIRSTPDPTPVLSSVELPRSTPDRGDDQQESDPIGPDRPGRSTPDPDPVATGSTPRSDPTGRPDPTTRSTRPDRPATRSIDDLVIEAHAAIDRGDLDRQPSAESIRKALSIAPARAREVRDRLRGERPLRVVGLDS